MLTEKQEEQIRKQILQQLENSDIPNKEELRESILSMSLEELEQFVKQNSQSNHEQTKCVFCSIIDRKIPSFKISENSEAIAVLEINPISEGHTLIIPKIHSEEIPKKAFELSEKISERIIEKLKPKKTETFISSLFNHDILNVIPIYKNENKESPRKKSNPEELKNLAEMLRLEDTQKEDVVVENHEHKKEIITDKNTWLPRRIP